MCRPSVAGQPRATVDIQATAPLRNLPDELFRDLGQGRKLKLHAGTIRLQLVCRELISMKKRYIYALMFSIPALASALLISAVLFAVSAGILWLFVFGDSPWPNWTNTAMSLLFGVVFTVLWGGAIAASYRFGKRLEVQHGFNQQHFWVAFGATVLPVAIILFHQLSVGNLGPKSDIEHCMDYCSRHGFAGSNLTPSTEGPVTCSCVGPRGETHIPMLLDAIIAQSK